MPLELLTFGISFLVKAIQQHMAQSQQDRAEERKFAMQMANVKAKATRHARNKIGNIFFSWTSTIIAIMAVFGVIVLPKLAIILDPSLSVSLGYQESVEGFSLLGIFELWRPGSDMEFKTLRSILITPVDTHLVSAIAGAYFGGINVRRKS